MHSDARRAAVAAAAFIVALATSAGLLCSQQFEPLPKPDSPLMIAFRDGSWFQVRTIEKQGPMILYTEMGGSLVSAPEQIVDWESTVAVNEAMVELAKSCASTKRGVKNPDGLSPKAMALYSQLARKSLAGCVLSANRSNNIGDAQSNATTHSTVVVSDRDQSPPRVYPTPTAAQLAQAYAEMEAKKAKEAPQERSAPPQAEPPSYAEMERLRGIQAHCVREWPDDFRMQNYCKDQQLEAAESLERRKATSGGLTFSVYDKIHRKCISDWPDDFKMQDYCEEQQIEGYQRFNQ